MSDGQHYARVRAYQWEKPWAPRYVANELAASRQGAESYRQAAAMRTAEAANAGPEDRVRLEREARESTALAEMLDRQIDELQIVDAPDLLRSTTIKVVSHAVVVARPHRTAAAHSEAL